MVATPSKESCPRLLSSLSSGKHGMVLEYLSRGTALGALRLKQPWAQPEANQSCQAQIALALMSPRIAARDGLQTPSMAGEACAGCAQGLAREADGTASAPQVFPQRLYKNLFGSSSYRSFIVATA